VNAADWLAVLIVAPWAVVLIVILLRGYTVTLKRNGGRRDGD
jgi:hypothetical protein